MYTKTISETGIKVQVILGTRHPEANDAIIWTIKISNFPKVYLAELNTHSVLKRSVSSSRAITTKNLLDSYGNDHYIPNPFTKNMKGMSANDIIEDQEEAGKLWEEAFDVCAKNAEKLNELGVHKQHANRLLEPFLFCDVVLTGTEWENFFLLRDSKNSQPEMRELARKIRLAMSYYEPKVSEYHIPFIYEMEEGLSLEDKYKLSAARCARTSYLTKKRKIVPDQEKDIKLADMLLADEHMSPFEHQAKADSVHLDLVIDKSSFSNPHKHRHLYGWIPRRVYVERKNTVRDSWADF